MRCASSLVILSIASTTSSKRAPFESLHSTPHLLRACLDACVPCDQADSVQLHRVFLSVRMAELGYAHVTVPLEPGSRETVDLGVSTGLGSCGAEMSCLGKRAEEKRLLSASRASNQTMSVLSMAA